MYGMHIGMGKLPYRSKDSHTQIAILHTRWRVPQRWLHDVRIIRICFDYYLSL
jgi:hypothetical protein